MRRSPLVLLLVATIGCGSGTQHAKRSAKSGDAAAGKKRQSSVAQDNTNRIKLVTTETLWATLGDGVVVGTESLTVSPDANRFVALKSRIQGRKEVGVVIVDGKETGVHDDVLECKEGTSFLSSPNSKRIAYVATSGEKQLVVVDGVEGMKYDGIGYNSLVFSADGNRVAYLAKRRSKWVVVVDGVVKDNEYDEMSLPVFSPDGERVAHNAKRGSKLFVVVDGLEGDEYDATGIPVFSPDGKRVAYQAEREGKIFVVVDGAEGDEFDEADTPVFSPDSKRVAYLAMQGNKSRAVVDGAEVDEYDGLVLGGLVFSSDGKRVMYAVKRGSKLYRAAIEIIDP